MLEQIQNIANIVTCLSLLLYVIVGLISGIISFVDSKNRTGDTFIWDPNEDILKSFKVIYRESYGRYKSNTLLICGNNILLDIKGYKIYYENGKYIKEEQLFYYKKLLTTECILFSELIPEGMPNIIIEWRTPNFMKGSLPIQYNGLSGNIFEQIEYKHTFKSFFYCMFNRNI